jgi:hypothetical protein
MHKSIAFIEWAIEHFKASGIHYSYMYCESQLSMYYVYLVSQITGEYFNPFLFSIIEEWLVLLHHIWEFQGWNLGLEAGYPDNFCGDHQPLQADIRPTSE